MIPEAEPETQLPALALLLSGNIKQVGPAHDPVGTHVPFLHVASRVPRKSGAHTGTHVVPLPTDSSVQFPAIELLMAGIPEQFVVTHVPVKVHSAFVQVAERSPKNCVSQVGLHLVPEREPEVQVPALAFAILGKSIHEVLVHVPLVDHVPERQVAESSPKNSALHVGVHVFPERIEVQFPGLAFSIGIGSVQMGLVHSPVKAHFPNKHMAERVPVNVV